MSTTSAPIEPIILYHTFEQMYSVSGDYMRHLCTHIGHYILGEMHAGVAGG